MGISPLQFYDLTPRDVSIILEAQALKEKRRRHLHVWAAWKNAAWGRSKKMPDLRSELRPYAPRDRRVMDRSQIRSALMDMAKAMNIPVVFKKKTE